MKKLGLATVAALVTLIAAGQVHSQDQPLTASIAFDPAAMLSNDRINVTLTGRYTCGPLRAAEPGSGTFAGFSGSLLRASGRQVASTIFGLQLTCDGTEKAFQVDVPALEIPWHGGPARVRGSLTVQDCTSYPCDTTQVNVNTQVKLR